MFLGLIDDIFTALCSSAGINAMTTKINGKSFLSFSRGSGFINSHSARGGNAIQPLVKDRKVTFYTALRGNSVATSWHFFVPRGST